MMEVVNRKSLSEESLNLYSVEWGGGNDESYFFPCVKGLNKLTNKY